MRGSISVHDPWTVLNLDASADEAAIRSRYLELVRENPPDRNPVRPTKEHIFHSFYGHDTWALWLDQRRQPWREMPGIERIRDGYRPLLVKVVVNGRFHLSPIVHRHKHLRTWG